MEKTIYEIPLVRILQIRVEGTMLTGSVETMRTVEGSWEEDDE